MNTAREPDGVTPPATILVVDDNEANRTLARMTLEDEGYRVVTAHGGAEAIEAFRRDPPDCILLDVRMPEIDGLTVCERIRAQPTGTDTPIVFLTALRDVDTFDSAMQAGGDDFLTKPVRPNELIARVESALKLRRMRVELREHYDLLKRQRDDLLRLSLQKERLMAFVVHDLKNPVNAMDLHAQVCLRDPNASERVKSSARQIRTEAKKLTRMIMNLLDLSKGDEGKLTAKVERIDVSALVREAAAEAAPEADARSVAVVQQVGDVGAIDADPDLLQRVVTNVLDNAIRHAPERSTVTVDVRRADGGVEFRVSDQGAGVPEDLRERIFEPFQQLDGSQGVPSSRSGRGLGLAFCKLAVQAHRGRIWVEDAAPGAVVVFRIPSEVAGA